MSYCRSIPLAALVAGIGFILSSPAQQPPAPKKPPGVALPTQPAPAAKGTEKVPAPPAPEPIKSDPEAQKVIDDAIKALESKPIQWFQADLWQRMEVQGIMVHCDGPFLYGPNYKLHLDLNVRTGDSVNRLEIRCDGATRWEVRQLKNSQKEIQRLDWGKVARTLNQPGVEAQDREMFLSSQSFSGILPLLKTLRQDFAFTKHEKIEWDERSAIKLTGVWASDVIRNPVPPHLWPGAMPRQCCVYLDTRSNLPRRLEWWGPSNQGGRDTLLLQMELRNPKINVELAPERVAQVFKYSAVSDVPIRDVTEDVVKSLQIQFERRRTMQRAK